jgi:hypothetical protein
MLSAADVRELNRILDERDTIINQIEALSVWPEDDAKAEVTIILGQDMEFVLPQDAEIVDDLRDALRVHLDKRAAEIAALLRKRGVDVTKTSPLRVVEARD